MAEAGQPFGVTIATNMAGRGVDIKLGGDPEHLAIHELKKQGITYESEGYHEALEAKAAELGFCAIGVTRADAIAFTGGNTTVPLQGPRESRRDRPAR